MKQFIISMDLFGYPISLNVNKSQGAAHKTLYGGIASLFIRMILASIFLISMQELITGENQKTKSKDHLMTS